ncbi:hypothetical protein [Companilactobacillus heilongjiangensis]|uniref:hypothetical protein n=1 Tax=Companilactobacillus heilongjiangensis TaxID=1074467 RepID=UPI0012FC68AE|nr:hypothetical protein [Companilactobacillus heilongjiangensis]
MLLEVLVVITFIITAFIALATILITVIYTITKRPQVNKIARENKKLESEILDELSDK